MIYSKTCEYAIRALAYLAEKKDGQQYTMIPEISERSGVPKSYIAKIFQKLVRKSILASHRGPAGGFVFKEDPRSITLKAIIEIIDDVGEIDECVMGLEQCDCSEPCPLHEEWYDAKRAIFKKLESCSLADMKEKKKRIHYRGLKRSRLNLEDVVKSSPSEGRMK